ncbi:unnamed protein product, partial [Durusdinium trenchii]
VRGLRRLFVADAAALPGPPGGHTAAAALLVAQRAVRTARRLAARDDAADEGDGEKDEEDDSAEAMETPHMPLPDGWSMPTVALGTGTMPKERVADAVATFVALGGRHIDTAAMYENYLEIRQGLDRAAETERRRTDVFITSKVMPLGAQ